MHSEAKILKKIIDRGDCTTIKCEECPLRPKGYAICRMATLSASSSTLKNEIQKVAEEKLMVILSKILEAQ